MKILEVTSEGLVYLDRSKKTVRIDFNECSENWIQYIKREKAWTEEEETRYRQGKVRKCVGQRDHCGKPRYFELFTNPITRIEFTGWFASKRFLELQQQIIDAGWSTFDLS